MEKLRNLHNLQLKKISLYYTQMKSKSRKETMRQNLWRLIEEEKLPKQKGWQKRLALELQTTPQHLNAILRGDDARGNIGPDIWDRLCKRFKVDAITFLIDTKTPIVASEYEQQDLELFRRERAVGVAEDNIKYRMWKIEEAEETLKRETTNQDIKKSVHQMSGDLVHNKNYKKRSAR